MAILTFWIQVVGQWAFTLTCLPGLVYVCRVVLETSCRKVFSWHPNWPFYALVQWITCASLHQIVSFVFNIVLTSFVTDEWADRRTDKWMYKLWTLSPPASLGNINKNCLCVTVLCTITMVHKDMSSSYRSVDCIGLLILLGLALRLPTMSVSSWCYI